MAKEDRTTVEVIPIGSLTPDAANVRRRDDRARKSLAASLVQFGPARSIVLDGKGIIRAGNGTVEAAQAAGCTEVLVVTPKPGQLVAVKRDDWSATEATGYAIADNRLGDLATFDDEGLAAQLEALQAEEFDLDSLGFTEAEIDELIPDNGGNDAEDPGAQIDKAEELREKWETSLDQLWIIPSVAVSGKEHRLLCGDSTKADDVGRVMAGEKALLMNTDPPYGIGYDVQDNYDAANSADGTHRVSRYTAIDNDELTGEGLQTFLEACIRVAVPHLADHAAFYLWHPMLTQGTFFAAAAAADILIHRQIIWVKSHFIFGRGDYHWKHELCFYGWRRGNRPEFYGERNQDTIWQIAPDGLKDHPSQKPAELFTRPILNHTRPGELVYEPFAGSGSQFVSAEQNGRICAGLELAPKYVAVILERLAGLGLAPRLAG